MNLKEKMTNMMTGVKKNCILLGYITSKYLLEIIACIIIVASYVAMFLSYGLMTISNKIYVFINITYDDFGDYELEKFVDTAVKSFYTKFPVMKKYFVTIKVKKEKKECLSTENYDIVDLTIDDKEDKENKKDTKKVN